MANNRSGIHAFYPPAHIKKISLMIHRSLTIVAILALHLSTAVAQSSEFYNYIEKYKKIAIREMERAGVPASIKLAQGLLESNAGRSELARRANNHFGMKCGSRWTGKTYRKKDDEYDQFGNLKKSCFRKYRNAKDSYIAHSEFLRDPRKVHIYGFLFSIEATNYKRWARGLKRAGYATAGNYDKKLISLIETYNLDQYDKMANNNFPDRPKDIIVGLDMRKVNDAKVVVAKNGITAQEISLKTSVSINALNRYNENLPEISEPLPDGYRVFIQPKRNRFRGKQKWHYVKEGETMFSISQHYGIKLSKLYRRNKMATGLQPQVEERLKLKGFRVKSSERPKTTSEPKTEKVPVIIDTDGDFMEDEITPDHPDIDPGPPTTTEPDVPVTNPGTPVYYTVAKGDTLYSISRRNGITVDQLMRMNNLTSTAISIGQVLKVK